MKIRVGFIISDKIYIERLVSTLNRYYSDKLEIYSYTDVKVANESVENQRLDIVIVDETLQVNEYRNCCMAYFVESPDIDKIEGKKAICKFQKVELIYKDILALYSEYSSRITKRKRSGELAEVITFTSPACGSGVTSMAAAFALNCYIESFNRFLIISLDVLICRYSPLFRAFPALFISEEPHKSFYYPSCFRSQK